MTTFQELADQLNTTTQNLREFNPEDFATIPGGSTVPTDAEVATREAWVAGQAEADKVTADGLDAAGTPDGE